MRVFLLGAFLALGVMSQPTSLAAKEKAAKASGSPARALASWYGVSHQGRLTASGVKFDRNRLTAAHRLYPFGTLLRLTNVQNRRQVVVQINDRGPYRRGRSLDLSEAAARRLGIIERGFAWVSVTPAE